MSIIYFQIKGYNHLFNTQKEFSYFRRVNFEGKKKSRSVWLHINGQDSEQYVYFWMCEKVRIVFLCFQNPSNDEILVEFMSYIFLHSIFSSHPNMNSFSPL